MHQKPGLVVDIPLVDDVFNLSITRGELVDWLEGWMAGAIRSAMTKIEYPQANAPSFVVDLFWQLQI